MALVTMIVLIVPGAVVSVVASADEGENEKQSALAPAARLLEIPAVTIASTITCCFGCGFGGLQTARCVDIRSDFMEAAVIIPMVVVGVGVPVPVPVSCCCCANSSKSCTGFGVTPS